MPLGQWSAGLKKKINETKEGLGKSQCLKYQGVLGEPKKLDKFVPRIRKSWKKKVEIFLLNYFEAVER